MRGGEVTYLPTHYTKLQLGEEKDDLIFKQYFHEENGSEHGKSYKQELVFEFLAKGTGGKRRVELWIEEAFKWYRSQRTSEATVAQSA